MNTKTVGTLCLSAATLFTLSACGHTPDQLAAAQGYSCTKLAREIGKQEQRKESAQVSGMFESLTSVVADSKEERNSAGISSAAHSIDEADADKSMRQLNEIYNAKGCV